MIIASFFKKLLSFIPFGKKMYSRYIFLSLFKDLCTWISVFFIILFALCYIDVDGSFGFWHKMFVVFVNTFDRLLDNFNIICLVCCIIFYLRIKNSFNFSILESFGITSGQILKPIILLLLLFGVVNILIARPACIKLKNIRHFAEKKCLENMKIELKPSTPFVFIDNDRSKDYKIIRATYSKHDENFVYAKNATVEIYENMELSGLYLAKSLLARDHYIKLFAVNGIQKSSNWQNNDIKTTISMSTGFSKKALIQEIKNSGRIKRAVILNVYDHLRLLTKTNLKRRTTTEVDLLAREFFVSEIAGIFVLFTGAFLAFLICVSQDRNASGIKSAVKCFIIYFIILRIFHKMSQAVCGSFVSSVCFCAVAVVVCLFVNVLVLNKDWCYTLANPRCLASFFKKSIKDFEIFFK